MYACLSVCDLAVRLCSYKCSVNPCHHKVYLHRPSWYISITLVIISGSQMTYKITQHHCFPGNFSICVLHVWVYMYTEAMSVIFLNHPPLYLLRQGQHWTWSSPNWLDWLSSKPQGTSFLHPPVLALQASTPWPAFYLSSCLCSKHITNWAIFLSFFSLTSFCYFRVNSKVTIKSTIW